VTETRAATNAEVAAWRDDWRARLDAWYRQPDVPANWVSQQVERQMAMPGAGESSAVLALESGAAAVGMLALVLAQQDGSPGVIVSDIWIAPGQRRKGHGTAALREAERWAAERRARSVWVLTDPADPVHAAFFRDYPLRARQMIKRISAPGPLANGLEGRKMTVSEFADWRAESAARYAANLADSGTVSAADAAASSAEQYDALLPDGLSTENHSFLCLCAHGQVVATNWLHHHYSPGMSWVYGVETHEGHRGKGYGRAAMVIGEQATLAAGDTHLALNVFGHNAVAIGMYEAMGYRAYDHGRSIELKLTS
jgi:GNAT superfamily N-acetyltransferase